MSTLSTEEERVWLRRRWAVSDINLSSERVKQRQRDRQRQTETDRDRQRQTDRMRDRE